MLSQVRLDNGIDELAIGSRRDIWRKTRSNRYKGSIEGLSSKNIRYCVSYGGYL